MKSRIHRSAGRRAFSFGTPITIPLVLLTAAPVGARTTPVTATGRVNGLPAPGIMSTNGAGQIIIRANVQVLRNQTKPRGTSMSKLRGWMSALSLILLWLLPMGSIRAVAQAAELQAVMDLGSLIMLERRLRRQPAQTAADPLKLYPEDRDAPHPTTSQLLKTFEGLSAYTLTAKDRPTESS